VWNEKTKQLVADGKLTVLGVVQEQHAERARLYKQWKQYKFPIAQDSITGLGLAVVPVPVLIDEHGYVMKTRLRPSEIDSFISQPAAPPETPVPKLDAQQVTVDWLKANSKGKPPIEFSVAMGDALLRSNSAKATRAAIDWYRSAGAVAILKKRSEIGQIQFRLGVAHRTLFDQTGGDGQNPDDFSKASHAWSRALEKNPNQYIWRRRIQQYGPRQIKPYPFYDWVELAQQEISGRGETPVELLTPLSGAEIAQPGRRFEARVADDKNPDPQSRIAPDDEQLIRIHATVVPNEVVAGQPVRIHLRFDPQIGKWNNEAEPMQVWINDSESGTPSASRLVHANAKEPSSNEPRVLEFEFETSQDASAQIDLTGFALYFVCKTEDGQCLYRRQEFTIPIKLVSKR
jgi:hypothetical protein